MKDQPFAEDIKIKRYPKAKPDWKARIINIAVVVVFIGFIVWLVWYGNKK